MAAVTSLRDFLGEKSVMLDSENYELNYQLKKGDKNPSHFDYELRISFKPHEKQLWKRYLDYEYVP